MLLHVDFCGMSSFSRKTRGSFCHQKYLLVRIRAPYTHQVEAESTKGEISNRFPLTFHFFISSLQKEPLVDLRAVISREDPPKNTKNVQSRRVLNGTDLCERHSTESFIVNAIKYLAIDFVTPTIWENGCSLTSREGVYL